MYFRAQPDIDAMTNYIELDDRDGATVTRRGTDAHQRYRQHPRTSAADDNDCDWPLVPLPEGHLGIPSGLQESNRLLSSQSAFLFHLSEEVTRPQLVQASSRSSWRATLGRLAYVAAVSVAMFGWLYLLWLALVSSVEGISS